MRILLPLIIALPTISFAKPVPWQKEIQALAQSFDGKAGICAMTKLEDKPSCINGQKSFPMQSVMKLVVATAVIDRIDQGQLKWYDTITLKPEDGSPGPREFYDLIKQKGTYKATIEELIRRSLNDSDSTAVDALIRKLGGISVIQNFLKDKGIEGLRLDRDERQLQAEFHGLKWESRFADPDAFDKAIERLSKNERAKAIEAYLEDPRDTASPEGMIIFLQRLFSTKLLSKTSTEKLPLILEKTKTGQNRLRAGIPPKWTLGNKTGTSASLDGRFPTTNDVGVITSPEGFMKPIVVFLSDSRWSDEKRAALMAKAASIVSRAKD